MEEKVASKKASVKCIAVPWDLKNPKIETLYFFNEPITVESVVVGLENGSAKPRTFNRGRLKKITTNKYIFIGPKIGQGKNKNKRYKFARERLCFN